MDISEILSCTDINTLYKEKVDLTEKVGRLHRSVRLSEGEVDQVDHKAELTSAYAVLEAVNHKLDELEELGKMERNNQLRIQYNFMKIAKATLKKETYDKIYGMSQNALKDMKPMFKELRKNQVET